MHHPLPGKGFIEYLVFEDSSMRERSLANSFMTKSIQLPSPLPTSEIPRDSRSHAEGNNGFTLTELLVVIAMAAILVIFMTPALSQTKSPAKSLQCMVNMRRLIGAWRMFAEDNLDKLVPNSNGGATMNNTTTWVGGWVSWDLASVNTNKALLQSSPLAQYLNGDITPFRCPADVYLSSPQQAQGWPPRVRSVSMNGFVGDQMTSSDPTRNAFSPAYRQWLKMAEISQPANYFVFIEEHPDSINDGYFINNPAVISNWIDVPASYHDGSVNISYADQHVETHKWRSSGTKMPIRFQYFSPPLDSLGRADYQWLATRTAVLHQ
jgi:prepilin-type N-terminal cleavage/methylation domain-containing protein